MKNPWLVYVTVVVISALAGIAIAGTPNRVGTDGTIVVPAQTTTTTTPPVADDAVDAGVDDTSVADVPASTAVVTTVREAETTTTTTTTTLPPEPEIDLAEVGVVAVNGAGVAGLAGRLRDELVQLGFDSARATDGTDFVDETVIYFLPGFEGEAAAVGFLLDIDSERIRPIADAPEFGKLVGDEVAVYAGRDRS